MPFSRPTLSALAEQALTDVADAQNLRAVLRFRPDYALALALAGQTDGLYGYLDWIAKQAVPATSTGEYRAAWAALRGVFPKPGTPATGTATFTGTPGAVLPVGTVVNRADGSASYTVDAGATVGGGGTVTVALTATANGPLANAAIATPLTLAAAVAGITSAGVAASVLTDGADPEEVDSDEFLTRMLLAYAEPAQGGAPGDYLDWMLEVPGVTRAWVQPNGMGPGTVIGRFMMGDAFPVGTNGVATAETRDAPATGDQLAVANHVYPLRPATALFYAVAPTAQAVAITIANLATDTAEIRAAISAALTAMLRARGEPGGTIYPSDIAAAVDGVAGVTRFSLAAPSAPVTMATGALPTLGTVTYT